MAVTHPFANAAPSTSFCKGCSEAGRRTLTGSSVTLYKTPGGALICGYCDTPTPLLETRAQ
jgi:hypothetical protein